MDFSELDASNPNANALKLVAYKRDTTLDLTYWYDVTKFLTNNQYLDKCRKCKCNTGVSKSNSFIRYIFEFKSSESLKIGTAFGAKVAYVESGTVLYRQVLDCC